jgi:hypothetical protein
MNTAQKMSPPQTRLEIGRNRGFRSDTTCGNVLLDRVFIKGDLTEGIPAFLDFFDLNA